MTFQTLDSMVRSVLLQKGYTMHWYLQALISARDCFRELVFDSLPVINTKIIGLSDAFEAEIPSDCQDYIKVGVMVGQFIRPLVRTNTINRLVNRDSAGAPTPYTSSSTDTSLFSNLSVGYFGRTITWNDYGENVGRLFGYNAGYDSDVFAWLPERNAIQVSETCGVTEIVLEYIGNGMDVDAASQIDGYAQKTIETYIMWQFKEQNRSYSEGEKERAEQMYLNEVGKLRARLAGWDLPRIKRIIQKNSIAAPK